MSTYTPPPPYQLAKLYPPHLELVQVQVLFRHGERTPVSPRFQNAGIPAFWPYCRMAARYTAAVGPDGKDTLSLRRRIETSGGADGATITIGGYNTCLPGELTDLGRATSFALGRRLRAHYIDTLHFLPSTLSTSDVDSIYLRATPIVRTLHSLHHVTGGLYPGSTRAAGLILNVQSRSPADETLSPNPHSCARLAQLQSAFADAAAEKWNGSREMGYLQQKLGKWMPDGQSVCVDSKPRLSGIQDSVYSTLAHAREGGGGGGGGGTRLPEAFYEEEVKRHLDRIVGDEWFRGYVQSAEYRRLGVGRLLGEIAARAGGAVDETGGKEGEGIGKTRLALMGCHDTTIGGVLTSLGGSPLEAWPAFTSSIVVETFHTRKRVKPDYLRILSRRENKEDGVGGSYVRILYNDVPFIVTGCRGVGRHMEGDESFCTMKAFKEIVGKMVPREWKKECNERLDKVGLPQVEVVG